MIYNAIAQVLEDGSVSDYIVEEFDTVFFSSYLTNTKLSVRFSHTNNQPPQLNGKYVYFDTGRGLSLAKSSDLNPDNFYVIIYSGVFWVIKSFYEHGLDYQTDYLSMWDTEGKLLQSPLRYSFTQDKLLFDNDPLITESDLELSLGLYQLLSQKNQPGGYAGLGFDGKLNPAQLPPLAITSIQVVDDEAERLALTNVQEGDAVKQTDDGKVYLLSQLPASDNANWVLISDSVIDYQDVTNFAAGVNFYIPFLFVSSPTIALSGGDTVPFQFDYIGSTGVSVGDTVSSGVDNRVFFQSGGLLSQSPRLQFNGTDFSLTNDIASTAILQTQNSPYMFLRSNGWDTGSSTDKLLELRIFNKTHLNEFNQPAPGFVVESNTDSAGWGELFSVKVKTGNYLTSQLKISNPYAPGAWGSIIESYYTGDIAFKDLAGNYAALQFNRAGLDGYYANIWAQSFTSMEFRSHFGGNITFGAGRPLWVDVANTGNTGSEFVKFEVPLQLLDGKDVLIGSSTGSKIGQSTSKLSVYGATPVTQRTDIGTISIGSITGTDLVDKSALEFALSDIAGQITKIRDVFRDLGITN